MSLLIAPYGIEIERFGVTIQARALLIAPYGIEIGESLGGKRLQTILLIAPYGIEINQISITG